MSRVYKIERVNGVDYVNTKRDVSREDKSELMDVVVCDAADECNRLSRGVYDAEIEVSTLRHLLTELYDAAGGARHTTAGQRALAAIRVFDPSAAEYMTPKNPG